MVYCGELRGAVALHCGALLGTVGSCGTARWCTVVYRCLLWGACGVLWCTLVHGGERLVVVVVHCGALWCSAVFCGVHGAVLVVHLGCLLKTADYSDDPPGRVYRL